MEISQAATPCKKPNSPQKSLLFTECLPELSRLLVALTVSCIRLMTAIIISFYKWEKQSFVDCPDPPNQIKFDFLSHQLLDNSKA